MDYALKKAIHQPTSLPTQRESMWWIAQIPKRGVSKALAQAGRSVSGFTSSIYVEVYSNLVEDIKQFPCSPEAKEDPELSKFFNWDRLRDFKDFGGIRLEDRSTRIISKPWMLTDKLLRTGWLG